MHLEQNMTHWQDFVVTVIYLQVLKRRFFLDHMILYFSHSALLREVIYLIVKQSYSLTFYITLKRDI
jgi:hypothetical protein